jgi:hypothetical protein
VDAKCPSAISLATAISVVAAFIISRQDAKTERDGVGL